MIKKILIGVGAAVLIPALLFGTATWSYVRTASNTVREAVKSEVPPEFEVKRIKEIVDNLVPEMRKCMQHIAEQQVDIEYLNEEVARRESEVAKQEQVLLGMTADVDSGLQTVSYGGRDYSVNEVKRDLAVRFEKFKLAKETLDRDRQIIQAREKALAANQQKLENMINEKQTLEVKIAQLEARLKSIQAVETVSEIAIDDSQLAQAKQAIRDLNKQLDVKERMLDAEGRFVDLIPTEDVQPVPQDISQQVREYLGRDTATQPASVAVRGSGN